MLLLDSLLTAVRFRSETRSAAASSTVCGCVAIPWMFSDTALAAVICAAVMTATWGWA